MSQRRAEQFSCLNELALQIFAALSLPRFLKKDLYDSIIPRNLSSRTPKFLCQNFTFQCFFRNLNLRSSRFPCQRPPPQSALFSRDPVPHPSTGSIIFSCQMKIFTGPNIFSCKMKFYYCVPRYFQPPPKNSVAFGEKFACPKYFACPTFSSYSPHKGYSRR